MSALLEGLEAPLSTTSLPGTGGVVRVTPEDFEVEELPAYLPSGNGEHLFLWIEKRGRNTRDVVRELAAKLSLPERELGFAGLKDKAAVTRQYVSAPRVDPARGQALSGEGWRVLSAARHENKLKTGHLKGNRFCIRIRETVPGALERAKACAEALERQGLPNAFGPQRFGRQGLNAITGRALLTGASTPEVARARRDRFLRRIAISAYQALLFNRVLAERMKEGLLGTALPGDLMKKLDTGGLFTSSDPGADQGRLERFEISPTGPIFGSRMMQPQAQAWERESRVLAAEGLTLASFAPLKADGEGSRRALRLPMKIEVEQKGEALELRFALPKGSFATTVLREVMKPEALPELPEERDD